MVRWSILFLWVSALAACGFQLRGLSKSLEPLPFRTLLFVSSQASIAAPLQALFEADSRISLVTTAAAADATLQIVDESTDRQILTINRGGSVTQYQLVYQATFRITFNGEAAGRDIVIKAQRELDYYDQGILGKAQEEQLLWDDMRQEVARMLPFRLAMLRREVPYAASSPAGVNGVHSRP